MEGSYVALLRYSSVFLLEDANARDRKALRHRMRVNNGALENMRACSLTGTPTYTCMHM